MCDRCEWQDAANRAYDAANALPEWKTNRIEFLQDVAGTIEEMGHVTPRQLEVIENAEEEAD
jgi:hypothetical protein